MTEKDNSNKAEAGGSEDFIEHLRLQGIPEGELPSLEWVETALAFCEKRRRNKELINFDTILAEYPGLIPDTKGARIELTQMLLNQMLKREI